MWGLTCTGNHVRDGAEVQRQDHREQKKYVLDNTGAGPARKALVGRKHGRARIPCSRLLLGRGGQRRFRFARSLGHESSRRPICNWIERRAKLSLRANIALFASSYGAAPPSRAVIIVDCEGKMLGSHGDAHVKEVLCTEMVIAICHPECLHREGMGVDAI
jgi:hypothetical protein